MEIRDKILEVINARGPVLPVQISKEIGSNILIASAHLAELSANNRLKVSSIKVGSSPLYYVPGQEEQLQKYTENLNDKEKKAFDLLGQNKILRDSEQEPVMRVALREIKDFAVPLSVNFDNNKEIFWKWHLTGDEEAETLIKSKLNAVERPVEKKVEAPVKETVEKEVKEQHEEKLKEEIKETTEIKKEAPAEEEKPKQKGKEDKFLKSLMGFFEKNKINVVNTEVIKKNSEIDFIVEVSSVVGNVKYYCKAKNKKRISDSDLSNAYVKGQFQKLPVIVLSPGELSAKAQEMMDKELNNLAFKKV